MEKEKEIISDLRPDLVAGAAIAVGVVSSFFDGMSISFEDRRVEKVLIGVLGFSLGTTVCRIIRRDLVSNK